MDHLSRTVVMFILTLHRMHLTILTILAIMITIITILTIIIRKILIILCMTIHRHKMHRRQEVIYHHHHHQVTTGQVNLHQCQPLTVVLEVEDIAESVQPNNNKPSKFYSFFASNDCHIIRPFFPYFILDSSILVSLHSDFWALTQWAVANDSYVN